MLITNIFKPVFHQLAAFRTCTRSSLIRKTSSVDVTRLAEGDTVWNSYVPVDGCFLASVISLRSLEGQRCRRARVSACSVEEADIQNELCSLSTTSFGPAAREKLVNATA